jgi:hypothetical protein
MPLQHDDLISILLAQLTAAERNQGVVYIVTEPISAGSTLKFPRISIDVDHRSVLAFVDRDPMANWGHSCRYILLNTETGGLRSFEAQLPPFQQKQPGSWRVAYKAPSVPDALLAATFADKHPR